jgi:DNA-binding CsgD family transcriptional regulator
VAGDYAEGARWGHLLPELLVLAGAAAGIGLLLGRYRRARAELREAAADLSRARAEAARWRAETHELIHGLGLAIEQQFARWQLSRAEAEIGLLLLKGLSHKELAALRNTSERTVREQARAVYRKAGLGGRSELAAFFLEDLLLPGKPGDGLADAAT